MAVDAHSGHDSHSPPVVLDPPSHQRRKTLLLLVHRPVQLRRQVVDPPALEPQLRVGVDLRVRIQPFDLRRVVRAPDAERTDSHLCRRADRLHRAVEIADEAVDVVAAPVVERQPPSFRAIALVGRCIRKIDVGLRIGIEVVVEVDAVHGVAADHVCYHVEGALLHALVTGIHPHVLAVPVGVRCRLTTAEWIEPGVQLHPARVRLGHGEGQRVVGRPRAQEFGPRLEGGRVERVRHRPDLQKDRVQMQRGGAVEDRDQLALLLLGRQIPSRRPVEVVHRGHPNAAHLVGAGRAGGGAGGDEEQGREDGEDDGKTG